MESQQFAEIDLKLTLPVEVEPIVEEDPVKIIMQELLAFHFLNITLSEKEMMIIKIIVQQSPSMIQEINQCVLDIVKDGKIDSNDIPSFIKLIKSLYVFCHENNNIKININEIAKMIGPIVKYIVHIVLSKNDKSTPELVKCCDSLIDISVEMIQLQSNMRTKICNFAIC